eukprot:TRINITY_DN18112_c0_g1_i1.p1 TRINITY_DN18112_c0_g1~~TRINITY_DN18112_c0_g1_i1.p1  ORF type:complete len:344 (+),score=65.73 TRINITY_DN18112_c0_g1_i1:85-1116(+)
MPDEADTETRRGRMQAVRARREARLHVEQAEAEAALPPPAADVEAGSEAEACPAEIPAVVTERQLRMQALRAKAAARQELCQEDPETSAAMAEQVEWAGDSHDYAHAAFEDTDRRSLVQRIKEKRAAAAEAAEAAARAAAEAAAAEAELEAARLAEERLASFDALMAKREEARRLASQAATESHSDTDRDAAEHPSLGSDACATQGADVLECEDPVVPHSQRLAEFRARREDRRMLNEQRHYSSASTAADSADHVMAMEDVAGGATVDAPPECCMVKPARKPSVCVDAVMKAENIDLPAYPDREARIARIQALRQARGATPLPFIDLPSGLTSDELPDAIICG